MTTVIGAVQRLTGSRLRRGERALDTTRNDLLGWIRSYERPAKASHWATLTATAIAVSPFLPSTPPRLGPGRPVARAYFAGENWPSRCGRRYALRRLIGHDNAERFIDQELGSMPSKPARRDLSQKRALGGGSHASARWDADNLTRAPSWFLGLSMSHLSLT